jgi:ribosomal protein S18 acetylase RimI-like enzyme
MSGYDGHRGWVYYVAVQHSHRRQGVGTALMRHTEAALAARGCGKLNLIIRTHNSAVVGFYRSLGYESEERINMAKRLTAPPPGA